jgi:hemoglobin
MNLQEQPPKNVQGQPVTPFEWMGGETKVKDMVNRFYDLMDLEPGYTALRSSHGDSLDNARERLFYFLCGWLGGPNYYAEKFGHPMLRARHLPFSIGIQERDQWVACMTQAMVDTDVPQVLRKRLEQSFFQTADHMRNQ